MPKPRKRKHVAPVPFQGVEVSGVPATAEETAKAIRSFIDHFVLPARRSRASLFLLSPDKRSEHLRDVPSWIDPLVATELDGSEGFPQHLAKRFGVCPGIFITDHGALHMSLAEAASVCDDSIFVCAEDALGAFLFYDVGSPTHCSIHNLRANK